jgi:hypothetical protein
MFFVPDKGAPEVAAVTVPSTFAAPIVVPPIPPEPAPEAAAVAAPDAEEEEEAEEFDPREAAEGFTVNRLCFAAPPPPAATAATAAPAAFAPDALPLLLAGDPFS